MPFKIIRNDITKVRADAIVNTANPEPIFAAGTDGAIYMAAGAEQLLAERKKIGTIGAGEAAVTPAFALPAKYIIHTVGPAWWDGNHGEYEELASCYRKSLLLARQLGCESIAFPLISTGVYGFPKDRALSIALEEIADFLSENEMDVTLVVFDKSSFDLSASLVADVGQYIDDHYAEEQHKKEHSGFFGQSWRRRREDRWPLSREDEEEKWPRSREAEETKDRRREAQEPRREDMDESCSRIEFEMEAAADFADESGWDNGSMFASAPSAPSAPPPFPTQSSAMAGYSAAPDSAPEKSKSKKGRRGAGIFRKDSKSAGAGFFRKEPKAPESGFHWKEPESAGMDKPKGYSKPSLSDVMRHMGETFQERLLRLIDERGLTDTEVYKKANVDRKLFSKIRCNNDYTPGKRTAVALAIALELNLDETMDLLRRAGMALSPSSKFDLIIEYCINNNIYNIFEINALLFEYDQPMLGC